MDSLSNSHKSKEQAAKQAEKKIQKVVAGPVKQRKKSEIRKLTDIFLAEDISSVKSYIVSDVLIPGVKDAIENVVHLLLRGEVRGRRDDDRRSRVSNVSYREYYDRGKDRYRGYRPVRSGYDFTEYSVRTRKEAEEVLIALEDIISRYDVVSVADYNELMGVRGVYTDNRYGWSDLRNARVVPTRDGFAIELPKAVPID